MRVNLAHIRERSTTGGWIDFAVFDAKSTSGSDSAKSELLSRLTANARASGLRIEQSSLAYMENGQLRFFGAKNLVDYLSRCGLPRWTHKIDV